MLCVCVCWAIRPSLPVGVVMTINRPLHCHQDDDIDEKGWICTGGSWSQSTSTAFQPVLLPPDHCTLALFAQIDHHHCCPNRRTSIFQDQKHTYFPWSFDAVVLLASPDAIEVISSETEWLSPGLLTLLIWLGASNNDNGWSKVTIGQQWVTISLQWVLIGDNV